MLNLPYIQELGSVTQYVQSIIPDLPRHIGQHASYVVQQVAQEASKIPVPEFPAASLLALISALGASVYLLRRRKT